ncbi:dihydrolipoyl dehydrogenase family protein [Williamsia deligens]|uniref:Dihydrolipoyl dehydrogenase family protein n=1 Tax=Williamsia deligens TaxID=321325 RepID=A0ABW3G6Z8_9NOCA|nr:NAD(P)/FAD-dependent oxidoreductase [Williamsia deligens]MCP2194599.1 dihydrolipoamide dehydrogenase [Williamsia deligens]
MTDSPATEGARTDTYDVIVLGGGAVGEVAAQFAVANSDRTAAIVENQLLGGECSYWACMPSKALLRPLEVANAARHLDGVSVADGVDATALMARRDTWVSHYSDSSQRKWAADTGIDVVTGTGRLAGEKTVEVSTGDGPRTLHARHAVIVATGSTASVPAMFADVAPWTSRDATGVREVPESLIIIGGGVVACEAATWMNALGSAVTMLVRSTLLGTLDDFAGEAVAEALRNAGVEIRLGVDITAASRGSVDEGGGATGVPHGGPVTVTVDGQDITAAEILVAAGRHRTVDDIGLDTVGVTDPSHVSAPEGYDGVDWLYSVGDASFGPMLTHWGKYQSRIVGQRIAAVAEGRTPTTVPAAPPVPQVVFTDPEVASTGLSEKEARSAYDSVTVITKPITAAAGVGLLRDDASGTAQIVVDDATRTLVGATFVGPEAGELIHAATVAIVGKITVDDLWHAVPSYPTPAEIYLRLLEGYFGY